MSLVMPSLNAIARKLVEPGKGILAADESEPTIAKRFAKIGLPSTAELRRDYREMLFRAKRRRRHALPRASRR
jgi:fructose-bisphosphate aldolase class I